MWNAKENGWSQDYGPIKKFNDIICLHLSMYVFTFNLHIKISWLQSYIENSHMTLSFELHHLIVWRVCILLPENRNYHCHKATPNIYEYAWGTLWLFYFPIARNPLLMIVCQPSNCFICIILSWFGRLHRRLGLRSSQFGWCLAQDGSLISDHFRPFMIYKVLYWIIN